ncbi:MAG: anti-sigma factor family protein [Myxococcaceae bacterium]
MNERHLGDALHAYVDNELSVERALEARSHLATCERCRQDFEQLRALRDVLQRTLTPTEPSAAFLRKLRHSVRTAAPPPWTERMTRTVWTVGPLAAAALVVLFALPSSRRPSADLTGEVVAAHLRSLQAAHLTDVASSDRHTVKPWFQGKVPFSFPVRDFAEQGFLLEGGRLDYLAGQPVAALVYRARQHAINAFVWPAGSSPEVAPKAASRAGVQSLHWVSDGMMWWLVSDVDAAELERLASLLHEQGR